MKVGLIDVDGHHFPNLVLMKLSGWHKAQGDEVEWYKEETPLYDVVYMAKVFSDAYSPDLPEPTNTLKVVKGGTGYAIWLEGDKEVYHKEKDPPLPAEIESFFPDYSLYPEYTGWGKPKKYQTAYGFLTRGCPRACEFCHVVPKEGRCSHKVADITQFWDGQGNICLSDPNILACKEAAELLKQLVDTGAKIDFNQGLDARLITPEKAELLARMNLKMPHFAMDSMEAMKPVERGLKLYVDACKRIKGKWGWRYAKVFCLTNFDTTFEQDLQRIKTIQDCECWPYVMIYNKPSAPPITRRLQRWTNNAFCYSQAKDFDDYQRANYKEVLKPEKKGSPMKVSDLDITIYDFEVFHSDWIVVFFEPKTGEIKVYHNDPTSVAYFCDSDPILCGFNVKGYDQFILKGVIGGLDPQEVKEINDFIIEGGRGWDYPPLKEVKTPYITQVDLMDDMQDGLSLKAIEGHMGMNIRESGVDFTIERALTAEELEEAIHYCTADVMATYELFKLRENYLQTKLDLGELAGIEPRKALYMTNAKLTAAFLQAKPPMNDWTDERQYKYPDNLKREYIPQEVFDFFDQMYDPNIPDEELFKKKIKVMVGEGEATIGYGGIHLGLPHYMWKGDGTNVESASK